MNGPPIGIFGVRRFHERQSGAVCYHREFMRELDELFAALERSKFRRGFALKGRELEYLLKRGIDAVRSHAAEIVRQRLAPANAANDGRQTPTHNHPVFIAQHATATCCRRCLCQWHRIDVDHDLTDEEQAYVVAVIERWLRTQWCGPYDKSITPTHPTPHPPGHPPDGGRLDQR